MAEVAPRYNPHQTGFVKDYSRIKESRSDVVFPVVKRVLEGIGARAVLDFGGGDGRFLKELSETDQFRELAYYDISPAMRSSASGRLKPLGVSIYKSPEHIPNGAFDAVTFLAVWMELETEEVVRNVLGSVFSALSQKASLIAVVTHPCFREEPFSTFRAKFDNRRYLEDGVPFEVDVFDDRKSVRFKDFHWNFTALTRQAESAGFLLKRIYEIADRDSNERETRGCPWALLHFVKV
jgi:hypothetical protein